MGDAKGICPNAIVVAAAGGIVNKNKNPEISYSNLTPTGTTTNIKFVEKEES